MVNEKTTFSNQKHKQELVGLNSIQICHLRPTVLVCLGFYRQEGGKGGILPAFVSCTNLEKGV